MLTAALEAMRPHQWVKNFLVLAPLLFAHKLGDGDSVRNALTALVLFCALSSSIYLINDVVDRHADAQHPTKSKRPIASGRLPVGVALSMFVLLAGLAIGGAAALDVSLGHDFARYTQAPLSFFTTWPLIYFALNLVYSTWLKKVVIIDCLCIALGFQIRVHAGALAIAVETSTWILLCTFFFALFLAFCKRREEVARMGASAATRRTIAEYDMPFLDQVIAPLAALSILSYALYTVADKTTALHGPNMQFTVPFVVFGVFRYLFLVHRRGAGADPAKLLFRDRQLVVSGVLWALAVFAVTRGAPGGGG